MRDFGCTQSPQSAFILGLGLVAFIVAKVTPTLDKERAVFDKARERDAVAD
jgi:hypothetical protein